MPEPTAVPALLDIQALATLLRDDPAAAARDLQQRAMLGDVDAQWLYGQLCMEGKGVPRNATEGLHWYQLAASSGHAMAANMVGRCHELGQGTPADIERAAAWYRRAADAGLDWGMYNLAHRHATGLGAEQNHALAYQLYRRAAELGHAKSMNYVGRYLEEGVVGAADPEAAVDWYYRSAQRGDFRGQASYAGILAARGEIDQAVDLLARALSHGSPSFLREMVAQLPQAADPRIRALAALIDSEASR